MQRTLTIRTIIVVFAFWSGCNTRPSSDIDGQDNQASLSVESIPSSSQYSFGDELEVSGLLICAHCYVLNTDNTGLHHELPKSGYVENCASKCATLGYPIAVLTINNLEDSSMWIQRTSSSLFTDYMTQEVRVTGTYVADGLMEPTSIKVKVMTEWVVLY